MTTINPSLASAALTMQNQQNNSALRTDPKTEDRSQESIRSMTNGNSSVSLSELSQEPPADYLQINRQQSLQSADSVENKATESNDTTNGLTYASNLQTQSNYLANQPSKDK